MRQLRARLNTRVAILAIAATLPLVAALLLLQANEQEQEVRRAVIEHRRIASLAAAKASDVLIDGQRLVSTIAHAQQFLAASPDECAAFLGAVMADRSWLVNIVLMDARGEPLCSGVSVDPARFREGASRPWFGEALNADGPIVSDPVTSVTTGRPIVVVAERLSSPTRGILGARVVAAGIDVRSISRSFTDGDIPPGATLSLLDRGHRLIANVPEDSSDLGLAFTLPAGIDEEADSASAAELRHHGGALLIAPVRDMNGRPTDYHVVLSVDGNAAVAAAHARWTVYLVIIVAGLGAAGLFATLAARRLILTPAHQLEYVARRIASGDLAARATSRNAVGGIAGLADAINAMGEALEARERERDGTAETLERAKRQFELLFDQNPNPMWVYDAGTLRFLTVNEMAIQRYGYSRDEFLSMCITDIRPEEDVERCRTAAINRASPTVDAVRWRHRLKSGEVIAVEITSHTVTFRERPAVLVCARDITGRLNAERAREEAEERMRFALEAVEVGVWEANLLTGVSHWSTTNEAMHGLPPGFFGGTLDAFLQSVTPEDRDRVRQEVEEAVRERRNLNLEYCPTARPDRRLRSIGRVFYDEAGRATRGAGVTLDVTERRQMEEQLRHSQKLEAVGQLAGGVAHDFNNLLTVIRGNAELALSSPMNDQAKEDIGEIVKAAERAAKLTRQLLSFSRKQVVTIVPIDVDEMIRGLMPMLARLIEEDITLEYAGGGTGLIVMADRGELEQAIINLVVNARDAQPEGGLIRIEVAEFQDVPTATISIAVADHGCGMTPEVLSRAFEPFFTTKTPGKGTGLGLASVYGMVKQAGGEVTIDSIVGQGTRVTLLLQRVYDQPVITPRSTTGSARGQATILLVEDQDSVRNFAARVLRTAGYEVLEASNALEATRLSADHPGDIALLFSDVVMPGPSIADAIDRIRSCRPSIAVLMTSGYPDVEVRRRLGAVDAEMCRKPFSMHELLDRVEASIARRGSRLRPVA